MKYLTVTILSLLTLTSFGQDKDSVNSTEYVFVSEPMPSYPGGHAEMNEFIKRNLKYPKDSGTVQGKVYIEFVVNENGSLSDFRVVKGLVDSFDNSALKTVKKMPNWIPAKRDNKPVRTKIVIPITFD
jgi:periplasmic protein TonB